MWGEYRFRRNLVQFGEFYIDAHVALNEGNNSRMNSSLYQAHLAARRVEDSLEMVFLAGGVKSVNKVGENLFRRLEDIKND